MVHERIWLIVLTVGGALVVVAGCEHSDEIASYSVHKPPPYQRPASANPHAAEPAQVPHGEPTDRMLGAIVPLADEGWFFKLTGPKAAVEASSDAYLEFLKSVHFAEGKPLWTLPPGWQERGASQMRYATLLVPADGQSLELTVIKLPKAGDDQSYILANVNRWRGQMSLPPTSAAQVAEDSTKIELDGTAATLVKLLGHAAPTGMGRGPFMPGARDGN